MKNIIFLLIIISSNIFAARYWDKQVTGISTPELKTLLDNSNNAFQNKCYVNSINFIDKALEMKSASEFSPENIEPFVGPLRLQLLAEKARILFAISIIDPKIENICVNTLNEYKKSAEGKEWDAYNNLFRRLVLYYYLKDNNKLNKTFDEMINYDNNNTRILALGLIRNLSNSKALDFIKSYIKRNGTDVDIMYYKIIYENKNEKNVFQDAVKFLKTFPNADTEKIKNITGIARISISYDKPEQVKEYYKMLSILAIKQPGDKEHLETVGFLLNERKKLEAIMPELRNP